MKAIVFDQIGAPSVLHFTEVEKPTVTEPHDILVENKATSVNPVDAKVRSGKSNGAKIIGWDSSGVVVAVGSAVKNFKVGDQVWFAGNLTKNGTYAQFTLVDERIVGKKPSSVSHSDAAALPLVTLTAWEAILENMHIPKSEKSNKTILVVGGAGGVGSIGIQIAKKVCGLTVIATATREDSIQFCKKMGADYVISHAGAKFADELKAKTPFAGVDYILNTADIDSDEVFQALISALNPLGHLASILPPHAPVNLGSLFVPRKTVSMELMFSRPITGFELHKQGEILNQMSDLIDRKIITSTKTVEFSWKDVVKAHEQIDSGKTIGKIVLNID